MSAVEGLNSALTAYENVLQKNVETAKEAMLDSASNSSDKLSINQLIKREELEAQSEKNSIFRLTQLVERLGLRIVSINLLKKRCEYEKLVREREIDAALRGVYETFLEIASEKGCSNSAPQACHMAAQMVMFSGHRFWNIDYLNISSYFERVKLAGRHLSSIKDHSFSYRSHNLPKICKRDLELIGLESKEGASFILQNRHYSPSRFLKRTSIFQAHPDLIFSLHLDDRRFYSPLEKFDIENALDRYPHLAEQFIYKFPDCFIKHKQRVAKRVALAQKIAKAVLKTRPDLRRSLCMQFGRRFVVDPVERELNLRGTIMEDQMLLKQWKTIKPLLLSKWTKLKTSDLKGISPTVEGLVKIIQEKYKDLPKEAIIEDLKNLSDQSLKP